MTPVAIEHDSIGLFETIYVSEGMYSEAGSRTLKMLQDNDCIVFSLDQAKKIRDQFNQYIVMFEGE